MSLGIQRNTEKAILVLNSTPIGGLLEYPYDTIPTGYLNAISGLSIGQVGSGATNTGIEYKKLYSILWNNVSTDGDYILSSTVGADWLSDWNANKTITIQVGQIGSEYRIIKFKEETATLQDLQYLTNDIKPQTDSTYQIGDQNKKFTEIFVNKGNFDFKYDKTKQTGGFWGEITNPSTNKIVILPKSHSGNNWVGAILNNGKYLESETAITIDYSSTWASLDGFGLSVKDAWYVLYAYENSSGELDFDLSYMPKTTLSAGSPTTSLSINNVELSDASTANIGLCFNHFAQIVLFEDGDEFETPFGYENGAGFVIDSNFNNLGCKIDTSGLTSTSIPLQASLNKTDFAITTTNVYQINNFMPLDYTTGNIASEISTRGWADTGWRIRTNATGEIITFIIIGDKFYFTNGTGAADVINTNVWGYFNSTTSYANYLAFTPPDKNPIFYTYGIGSVIFYHKNYYETYGQNFGGQAGTLGDVKRILSKHGIITIKHSGASNCGYLGYVL